MKKLCISLCIGILCLGYYTHSIRQDNFLANWKLDIYDSESRILRDEVAELRSRPSYKQGVSDTILSTHFKTGFQEGALAAYENSEGLDYPTMYHSVMKSISANMAVQESQNKKKVVEAYHRGITDATESKPSGLVNHPDYSIPYPQSRVETTDE